jgi:hypothetical protein
MSKLSRRTAALGILSALALGTLSTAPAFAKGTKVTSRGACTLSSTSKLKVSHDAGAIETEFEVDSNRVGQRWNVVIKDNGATAFSGVRVTTAPSGSFTVARRIPNRAGTDRIVATAKNVATGERCVARASI